MVISIEPRKLAARRPKPVPSHGGRWCGFRNLPFRTTGNPCAPPGFLDWPFIAMKVDGKWEVRHRWHDWPMGLNVGGVTYYFFKTPDSAANALYRIARREGFQPCLDSRSGQAVYTTSTDG